MTNIATTSCEEEACTKQPSLRVFAGDGAGNRGLSRAGQAIQPEDGPPIFSICPVEYLLKNADAGVREASGFVLPIVRIGERLRSVG